MKPQAILFDWDNTLVDTSKALALASDETMARMKWDPDALKFRTKKELNQSARDALPAIFGDRWEEAYHIYKEAYIKHSQHNLSLMPFAVEMLDLLTKNDQIYLAVISNKNGAILREEAELLKLNHYFQNIIGSRDAEEDKPSPLPVHLCLQGSGIEPSERVWLIGDSEVDLECAVNSGCSPVLYGDHELDQNHNYGTVKKLKCHSEFFNMIPSMQSFSLKSRLEIRG